MHGGHPSGCNFAEELVLADNERTIARNAERVVSARLRDEEGRAWMLGEALFSIALGVSMWVGWPLSGLRALGVLLGAKLVSAGAVLLRVERGMQRLGAGVAALRARVRD